MAFCSKCATSIPDGVGVCPNCGEVIATAVEHAQQPEQPQFQQSEQPPQYQPPWTPQYTPPPEGSQPEQPPQYAPPEQPPQYTPPEQPPQYVPQPEQPQYQQPEQPPQHAPPAEQSEYQQPEQPQYAPPPEQPEYQQPQYQQPQYQQSQYQQPQYQQPQYQQSQYQQQQYQQPWQAQYQQPQPQYHLDPVRDVQDNKAMAIIAYFIFFIPLIVGVHKISPFARYHTNQGTILFIFYSVWGVVYGILMTIFSAILFSSLGAFILWGIVSAIFGLLWLIPVVLLILGVVNAAGGKCKPLPVIGNFTIIK